LFGKSCLIGYVPAKGFKEGIDEFYTELGFVIGGASIAINIPLESINKIGNLLVGFFRHFTPTPALPRQRGRGKEMVKKASFM
jgi:hypothetical protein